VNIRLPKSENTVTELLEVGITGFITLDVGLLDCIRRVRVSSRVSMPEVTIPLNNEVVCWYKSVNHKLAAYQVLLSEAKTKSTQDVIACLLELIPIRSVRESEDVVYALLIGWVVTTGHRAIHVLEDTSCRPSVLTSAAGVALYNSPVPTLDQFLLTMERFAGGRTLPRDLTTIGAVAGHLVSMLNTSVKGCAALYANVCGAFVTLSRYVRTGLVGRATSDASFRQRAIPHVCMIPKRLGVVNVHRAG
jgi:hypothetical protein